MQKKVLLSILTILLVLGAITGCGTIGAGAEAKVNYASVTTSGDAWNNKLINITVTLGNSVYIDSIEEVKAYVNDSATLSTLKVVNRGIDGNNKVISIYAFVDSAGTVINGVTTNTTNYVTIDSIKCKDENGNTIYVSGMEIMGKQTVTISSSSSGTGTTAINLTAITGLTPSLKSTTSGYVVNLTWTANPNATKGYKIYRQETIDGIFTGDSNIKVTDSVATSLTSYTDTAVMAGKTYFYRVTAFNGTKETDKQDIAVGIEVTESVAGDTGKITIPAVTGVAAEPDLDSILLTWIETTATGTEIIGYNIYGSTTVNGTYQKLTTVTNPNIIKANKIRLSKGNKFGTLELTTGIPMYLKVKAVALTGEEGNFSEAATTTMYDGSVPTLEAMEEIKAVPYGTIAGSTSALGVKVEWINKGVYGYLIQRSEKIDGTYSTIATVLESLVGIGGKTSIIDGSFMELKNKSAFYRIRCISATGALGKPSGSVQVTDYPDMLIPTITITANYLGLDTVTIGATTTKYKFYYDGSDKNGVVSKNDAEVTGLPLDFAGYKIYMSNSFDGEYILAGKVAELWGAEVIVDNLTIDSTKPIYVRVSTYDYFGNESGLSLRSSNLN